MIDIEFAMEKYAAMADMPIADARRRGSLVMSSLMKIEGWLKEDADKSVSALVAYAAAADAYYQTCMLELSRTDSEVVAGSVTVRTNMKVRADCAREARDSAMAALAPYLRDSGFAFLSV